ncbi:ankyrin repeat-containing domain protein, partial [Delphinella strobiligena]
GNTPLCLAAKAGQPDIVRLLAEDTGVDVSLTNRAGGSPIALAAEKGRINVVKVLLEYGNIDLNARSRINFRKSFSNTKVERHTLNESQYTILFGAALQGNTELVQALIGTHGIDVNAGSSSSQTPLMAAASCANFECAKPLVGAESVDMNAQDAFGWTA